MGKSMTKLFFVLALVGVAVVNAEAQTIGVKLGPTFSKLSVDEEGEDGPETLTSFGGGGFIRFGMGGLNLQAEVLSITKGASTSISDPEFGDATFDLKLNYVEIPVTAMFSLGSGPYLFAGPSVAFEVSCKIDIDTEDFDIEGGDCDDDSETDSDRKKVDLSVVGGAGFEFPMGPGRLLIEGRYIYGLTNLNDSSTADDSSSKNRTWAIFAGFAVPIGR